MSEDPIKAAAKAANTRKHRDRLKRARSVEWAAKQARKALGKEHNDGWAGAITRAKRAFRTALVPPRFRRYVAVRWTSASGVINWDDRDARAYSSRAHLSYEINVGSFFLTGFFWPECVEDCMAAGWGMWPAVETLLRLSGRIGDDDA